jgi:hypothetical protein
MEITATVRDVAIIVLAVESIVIGALLAFLSLQMYYLVRLIRDEIKPMLDSTNETVNTVRGTTVFLSETVASPVIKGLSYLSALQGIARSLTYRRGGRGR